MKRLGLVIFAVILMMGFFVAGTTGVQASWGGWSCKWTVVNYPVTGGYVSGRGCVQWTTQGTLLWRIWGDTYAPWSRWVYTRVQGYEGCGEPTQFRVEASRTAEYTNYGTSGVSGSVVAFTCPSDRPHRYRVVGQHARWEASRGTWEGTIGSADW
jgi:hypothetical protein